MRRSEDWDASGREGADLRTRARLAREARDQEGRLQFARTIAEGMDGALLVFIVVGTPTNDDGSADFSSVEAAAREIAHNLKTYTAVAEMSTVLVETGECLERTIQRHHRNAVSFDVMSNPEFLREGTAIHDFLHPDRLLPGVKSRRAEEVMTDLYDPLHARVLVTHLKSAELIKHASNSFLATRISFINALSRICEAVGLMLRKWPME